MVADGDVPAAEAIAGDVAGAGPAARLVIAADGGARKAELLGLRPDVVVGDLDSLSPESLAELRRAGVEIIGHPVAMDASDTELAVLEAARRGATEIFIIAALGGLRFDHALANVLLLWLPELAGMDVRLVDGTTSIRVLGSGGDATLVIEGSAGDIVSLLPLSPEVAGVKTSGLAYALDDETLLQGPARGLSNVLQGTRAEVSARAGRLAVVHTRVAGSAAAHG